MLIFPLAGSGQSEGHFGWDSISDTTLSGGALTSAGVPDGTKQLTVTFKVGKQTVRVQRVLSRVGLSAIMTPPFPWLQLIKALPFVILLQPWPAYALDQREDRINRVEEIPTEVIAQIGIFTSSSPGNVDQRSGEPFGLSSAVPVKAGKLVQKWQTVNREIKSEVAVLLRCLAYRHCSIAAQKFLKIIAEGREHEGLDRVGHINRAINLSIVPMSDIRQWGVTDRWSSPLETLSTGHGDCEDYAIAKYVALLAAGVSKKDVKIVIARVGNEEHAIVTVRVAEAWIVLENRWLALVPDVEVRHITPEFLLDYSGIMAFPRAGLVGLLG
jgi:predicted transglutaminase-like cysteine proteinase